MTLPGIDGRKMSKNYDNTIPIFADTKLLRKQIMRIVTDKHHLDRILNQPNDELFYKGPICSLKP